MKFAKRTLDHYAAHGVNASFVVRDCQPDDRTGLLSFRRGRQQEGEAVQLEMQVEKHYRNRTVTHSASISFDQSTWDALVEFVKSDRILNRAGKPCSKEEV